MIKVYESELMAPDHRAVQLNTYQICRYHEMYLNMNSLSYFFCLFSALNTSKHQICRLSLFHAASLHWVFRSAAFHIAPYYLPLFYFLNHGIVIIIIFNLSHLACQDEKQRRTTITRGNLALKNSGPMCSPRSSRRRYKSLK